MEFLIVGAPEVDAEHMAFVCYNSEGYLVFGFPP